MNTDYGRFDFRFPIPGLQIPVSTVVVCLMALAIALGLKYHYSRAGSDDLDWILRPTAGVVELAGGIEFHKEAHTGYINQHRRIIIAPGCAGVNFMIIAFCMAMFSRVRMLNGIGAGLAWMGISLAAAWGLAVAANAVRILVSIHLFDADIYGPWLTPESGHRIWGTGIYVICLYLLHLSIHRYPGPGMQMDKPMTTADLAGKSIIPLCWYVLVTIGVPLLNGAFEDNGVRFIKHGGVVVSIGVVVFLCVFLIQRVRHQHSLSKTG